MAIEKRDKPIDFNPLAVSGEPVGKDTWRFIPQRTSNDNVTEQNSTAGTLAMCFQPHIITSSMYA